MGMQLFMILLGIVASCLLLLRFKKCGVKRYRNLGIFMIVLTVLLTISTWNLSNL
ncbi:hypothetical protein CE91St36_20150 [Christensenellaceae bacterium]|nr:hypothetical protein CE91St36_20150 [Christensenellaceae bacterium]BDF61864.1 hypothetical protein CE91St37_20140 [Christensenellaceae bacterium]